MPFLPVAALVGFLLVAMNRSLDGGPDQGDVAKREATKRAAALRGRPVPVPRWLHAAVPQFGGVARVEGVDRRRGVALWGYPDGSRVLAHGASRRVLDVQPAIGWFDFIESGLLQDAVLTEEEALFDAAFGAVPGDREVHDWWVDRTPRGWPYGQDCFGGKDWNYYFRQGEAEARDDGSARNPFGAQGVADPAYDRAKARRGGQSPLAVHMNPLPAPPVRPRYDRIQNTLPTRQGWSTNYAQPRDLAPAGDLSRYPGWGSGTYFNTGF